MCFGLTGATDGCLFLTSSKPSPWDHYRPWCSYTHLLLHPGLMTLRLAMVIALVGGGVNPHTKRVGKEWKGLILPM